MDSADLSKENQIHLVRLAGEIDSDFEKAKLLSAIASLDLADDEVFEALGQEIDQIDSEHEYGKAMKALRRAGTPSRQLILRGFRSAGMGRCSCAAPLFYL